MKSGSRAVQLRSSGPPGEKWQHIRHSHTPAEMEQTGRKKGRRSERGRETGTESRKGWEGNDRDKARPRHTVYNECFAEWLADKPQSGDNYGMAAAMNLCRMNRSTILLSICLWPCEALWSVAWPKDYLSTLASAVMQQFPYKRHICKPLQYTSLPFELIDSIKASWKGEGFLAAVVFLGCVTFWNVGFLRDRWF